MGWILAVCLLAFCAGMVCYAYRIAFYVPGKRKEDIFSIPGDDQYQENRSFMQKLIQEMHALPCEEVFITSFDGTRLAARYYHVKDGAPLQIQCHGYRGTAIRDFCGGNKLARKLGFNTLVIDQRAHGKSEGHTITFGIKERYDCLAWVHFCCERFGTTTPIILAGVSMGAATVLMASELDFPENVIGIIADCPYSSPKEIICKVCRDRKLPTKLTFPFVWLAARLPGRFDLMESSAVEAVKHAKIPVLLIHGEDDRFVPCEMSRKIYEACPAPKMMKTFPGAGHGLSYIVDEMTYEEITKEFLTLCFKRVPVHKQLQPCPVPECDSAATR